MNSRHQDLFKTLIELYTLQIQLGNIATSSLKIPNNDTVFNRQAALEAGYTEEAVRVMAHMPYLSSEEDGFEIFPSTYVERYVEEPDDDVSAYQGLRKFDTNPFDEVYLTPSVLKLTKQNVYGYTFLYDTNTGLVREWEPFEDGINIDNQNFDILPAKPPAAAFGPWIDRYRKLQVFHYSSAMTCFDPDTPFSDEDPAVVETRENLRLAELKIRDLYLANGWNVNSREQDAFNKAKFIEERDAYREQVLLPLFDKCR